LQSQVFDCFHDPAETYRELLDFRPNALGGYPGALVRVAQQHLRQGGCLDRLRRLTCGGESLSPQQRRILEDAFGVPVHDIYGTSECNVAAWRCEETGLYHVPDDGVVLEVCRGDEPVPEGETGEVVITVLHSRTMPIIRYGLGDLAVAGPPACPCGAPFSTLAGLRGRKMDYIRLPGGGELHPFVLLNEVVLETADWLLEYQLVQESTARLRLLAVPARTPSDADTTRLVHALASRLGEGVTVDIELTGEIPRDASGKLHFCRSMIADGANGEAQVEAAAVKPS
jgi:phenylacetate-CoA ligase